MASGMIFDGRTQQSDFWWVDFTALEEIYGHVWIQPRNFTGIFHGGDSYVDFTSKSGMSLDIMGYRIAIDTGFCNVDSVHQMREY